MSKRIPEKAVLKELLRSLEASEAVYKQKIMKGELTREIAKFRLDVIRQQIQDIREGVSPGQVKAEQGGLFNA